MASDLGGDSNGGPSSPSSGASVGAGQAAPDERPSIWLGFTVLTASAVALGCLCVDGRNRFVALSDMHDQLWVGFTIYSLDHVVLGLCLLLAAVALLVVRPVWKRVTLGAVAGMCAAQLAGLGMVSFRRWPAFAGSYGTVPDWGLVRALAAVMAVICGIAAIACLAFVVRRGTPRRRALLVAGPLGLMLVVVLPFLVPWAGADLGDRMAVVLMYGLPFGVALAVTGLLDFGPAFVVTAAVAVSGVLMALTSTAFVSPDHLVLTIGLVGLSALANLLWRLPHRE